MGAMVSRARDAATSSRCITTVRHRALCTGARGASRDVLQRLSPMIPTPLHETPMLTLLQRCSLLKWLKATADSPTSTSRSGLRPALSIGGLRPAQHSIDGDDDDDAVGAFFWLLVACGVARHA